MPAHCIGNLFCALDLEDLIRKGHLGPLNSSGDRELYEESQTAAGNFEPGNFEPGNFDPANFDPVSFDPANFGQGSLDRGTSDTANFDPGSLNPGNLNPDNFPLGTFDPGNLDPGNFPPGTFEPGTCDPDSSDPGNFVPGNFVPGNLARPQLTARRVWFPEHFISRRTLVILGFTHAKADELWNHWPGAEAALEPWDFEEPARSVFRARSVQRKFLALMMGVMDKAGNTTGSTDAAAMSLSGIRARTVDPRELMSVWGLSRRAQDEILDPFKSVAVGQGFCQRWAREYIAARFFSLSRVWDDSLAREVALHEVIAAGAPGEGEALTMWEDLQKMAERTRFGDLQIPCWMLTPLVLFTRRRYS